MNDAPPPLVAAEVELTDFPFMALDVRRVRDSKFAATADGDAFMAGFLLWCASWHQIPAASLPDDDIELANLAGFGRVVKAWKRLRPGALYGWIKCSDGRLYHPVIAEKALEAWDSKLRNAYDRMCDRVRKLNHQRKDRQLAPVVVPSLVEWKAAGRADPVPPEAPRNSAAVPPEDTSRSTGIPAEKPLIGIGTGIGTGIGIATGIGIGTRIGGREGSAPPEGKATEGPVENREPPPAVNHQADWNAWDLVKAAYPKFSGRQDWLQPQHYAQRIVDSGDATWAQLEAGVKRYAAYVEAGGVSSTSHVLAPVKFFSAADRPWSQAWEPPTSLASRGKPPLKLRTSAEIEAEENARAER